MHCIHTLVVNRNFLAFDRVVDNRQHRRPQSRKRHGVLNVVLEQFADFATLSCGLDARLKDTVGGFERKARGTAPDSSALAAAILGFKTADAPRSAGCASCLLPLSRRGIRDTLL